MFTPFAKLCIWSSDLLTYFNLTQLRLLADGDIVYRIHNGRQGRY